MLRLFAFIAAALASAAVIGLANWRVDPLGDYYDPGATAAAQRDACLLSDDLVGVRSWWDLKRDLVRSRRADTNVVGTSRVLRLRGSDSTFVNVGLPGTAVPMLARLFRDLHAIDPRPRTIYLGVEVFWLNENWTPPYEYEPAGTDPSFRDLLTRQRLGRTVSLLAHRPPLLFRPWYQTRIGSRCVLDRAGRADDGDVYLWGPDGSMFDLHEVRPEVPRERPENDFERDLGNLDEPQYLGAYYANWRRLGHLQALEDALRLARKYGWRVVGFVPPYSPRYVERLASLPQTAPRWREVGAVLPALFHRFGHGFVDTRDGEAIGCAPTAYVDDGWHPDASCGARVLRLLERAATR